MRHFMVYVKLIFEGAYTNFHKGGEAIFTPANESCDFSMRGSQAGWKGGSLSRRD